MLPQRLSWIHDTDFMVRDSTVQMQRWRKGAVGAGCEHPGGFTGDSQRLVTLVKNVEYHRCRKDVLTAPSADLRIACTKPAEISRSGPQRLERVHRVGCRFPPKGRIGHERSIFVGVLAPASCIICGFTYVMMSQSVLVDSLTALSSDQIRIDFLAPSAMAPIRC